MFNNNVDMYLMSPPPLIIHRSSDVCLLLNIGLHCILILHREAVRVCSLSRSHGRSVVGSAQQQSSDAYFLLLHSLRHFG